MPTSRHRSPRTTAVLAVLAAAAFSPRDAAAAEPASGRVARVFVLAGQSNMEGQAVVDLGGPSSNNGKGTLAAILRDPAAAARLAHLRSPDGDWRTRDNVSVSDAHEDRPLLTGPWVDALESWEDSPNPGDSHHEFGNAETYLLVGDALGKAMVSLLSGEPAAATTRLTAAPAGAPAAAALPAAADPDDTARPGQPPSRSERRLEGFRILVDDRLLPGGGSADLGHEALEFLRGKLVDIRIVMPADRLARLREVPIVLDQSCGDLGAMQYHPSADWLANHGYPRSLARCVHLPRAEQVATIRNVSEQPWVILHELAHAYHDQVLGFDEPRIIAAWEAFKRSGAGDDALLYNGSRTRHYGLTNHKEFFAEMTEAYFGSNDFAPFNRAELKTGFPELHALLAEIWGAAR